MPTAADAASSDQADFESIASSLPRVDAGTVRQAVAEAEKGGALIRTVENADGSRQFTIARGSTTLHLTDPGPAARLGAGRDKNGLYVDFNQFDQGAIINGGTAITTHGIRCGAHVMRVHLNGKPGPKCL